MLSELLNRRPLAHPAISIPSIFVSRTDHNLLLLLPFPHRRKAAFLIDFSGKRKHSTPIGLAKEWVTVLQTCYPGECGLV
jgi:hypothetical protein